MTESDCLSTGEALVRLADNLDQDVGQLLEEDFTLDDLDVRSQHCLRSTCTPTKHLLLDFPARFHELA
jgi:hypothetical protein